MSKTRKIWVVQNIMQIRSKEAIRDGLWGFKAKTIETEHISRDIAVQAAKNVATEFPPDNGDHDNFDNMTNVKDRVARVVQRTITDDIVAEFKHEA